VRRDLPETRVPSGGHASARRSRAHASRHSLASSPACSSGRGMRGPAPRRRPGASLALPPPLRDRVRTLSQLVDDLFELARIDAGPLTIELTDARLDHVVAGCLRGFEAQARIAQVSLEARLGEALPAVRCAPDKVERVLLNLLTNALHHTPADGTIAVHVSALDGTVEVAV
jgi:signal transduction histidine kinase